MELWTLQNDLPILRVKLRQSVQILQSPLSDQVVRVGDEGHEDVQRGLECNLVVIVNDQVLEKAVW